MFQLLNARKVISSPDFKHKSRDERKYWIQLSRVDTVIDYGGRDSSKTFSGILWDVLAAADHGHRILLTRYVMNSTDNSISEALEERMRLIGYTSKFEKTGNLYRAKKGPGKIAVSGIKTSSLNQTARLKSLENFSVFKVEEAEELTSYREWVKIKRSMRAKDVQTLAVLTFNPPTTEHFLFEKFFEEQGVEPGFSGIKGTTLYIYSSWKDNEENMTEANLNEFREKEAHYNLYESTPKDERHLLPKIVRNDWEEYKYAILGGFRNKAEGVIYDDWTEGEFDTSLPYTYGLDFGSNDPDSLTKVAVDHKRKRIYIEEIYHKSDTSFDALRDILVDRVGFHDRIVADAAERRMIHDLYDFGLNIEKCYKPEKHMQIKRLQGYTLVVCGKSLNLRKGLRNYVWHDKKAGVPKHDYSDINDSWRYAAIDQIKDW